MGPNNGAHHFCLKWNNHSNNLLKVFSRLLLNECFTDVTLAAGGRSIRAHKMVLCACSTYFEQLFVEHPEPNPIVIMRETSYTDLAAIIEFIYKGEINVSQDQLGSLLRTAEILRVKGLAQVSSAGSTAPDPGENNQQSSVPPVPQVPQQPPALLPIFQNSILAEEQPENKSPSTSRRKRSRTSYEKPSQSEILTENPSEPESCPADPLDLSLSEGCAEDHAGSHCLEESEIIRRIREENREPSYVFKGYNVYKFNDYVTYGTRQQYWDESFTRAVMEGIQDRELDLKKGAEILGVSYSTLYGRYRESHGYLRHNWNKARERSSDRWWTDNERTEDVLPRDGGRSSATEELVVEVDGPEASPSTTNAEKLEENKESLILSIKHGKVHRKTTKIK